MNPIWVYPRLDTVDASRRLQQLRDNGPRPAISCPEASPPPIGQVVPQEVLEQVRKAATEAAATVSGPSIRAKAAQWDAAVGSALHSTMGIIPTDAADEGVWSFLALVLMPDLAAHRFPDLHSDRLMGRPRNVFRRLWWREEVLGDLPIPPDTRPLGEDEYVNIFERSYMVRCRPLARTLATAILSHRGANRSAFARQLTKNVRRTTGPLLLDALSETQLQDLVNRQADAIHIVGQEPS